MPSFYQYKDSSGNINLFDDNFIPADFFRAGNLWAWGAGSNGALGNNNTTINISTPVTTASSGINWKQVSCSTGGSSGGIKIDGSLWMWGSNSFGRLGTNDTVTKSKPTSIFGGGNNWMQISIAGSCTAAIKTDGSLWTWGISGSDGTLGVNDTITRSTPVTTFLGGNNWKQVSCGGGHIAAIKTDGSLWTWGANNSGQLGINNLINRSTPVTTLLGGFNWKQVSCGNSYTIAIKTDGSLWGWGNNGAGPLGIGNTQSRSIPTQVGIDTDWKQVFCGNGGNHTIAIKTDGSLWGWGLNASGQLGVNDVTNRISPIPIRAGEKNWKKIACGLSHTSAIKTDGSLWVWGDNYLGQLGVNDNIGRSTPVTTFLGGNNWKEISAGNYTFGITYVDEII